MEMEHALARTRSGVDDHAKSAQPGGARHLGAHPMQMSDQGIVVRREVGERGDVLARQHEKMRRCGRIDVADYDRERVLVHTVGGGLAGADSAEEALGHAIRLTGLYGVRNPLTIGGSG